MMAFVAPLSAQSPALFALAFALSITAFAASHIPGPGPGALRPLYFAAPALPSPVLGSPSHFNLSCARHLRIHPPGLVFFRDNRARHLLSPSCRRFQVLLTWARANIIVRHDVTCFTFASCFLQRLHVFSPTPSIPARHLLPARAISQHCHAAVIASCSSFYTADVTTSASRARRSADDVTISASRVRRSADDVMGRLKVRVRRSVTSAPSGLHFSSNPIIMYVRENLTPPTEVGMVVATDPESKTLHYSMRAVSNRQSEQLFEIDRLSGMVRTKEDLDREALNEHLFDVTVTQANVSTPKSATATLNITVTDANDKQPVCEENPYRKSIPEGTVAGSITTVRATDGDVGPNAQIRYRLADNSLFGVGPSNGSVYALARSFNREERAAYVVRVIAEDQAQPISARLSTTCTVSLTITDVNDNSPIFSAATYAATLREDHPVGRPAFLRVGARDEDAGRNGQILFAIVSGDESDDFQLDAVSGELMLRKRLDYERKKSYSLDVRAADNGTTPNFADAKVSIVVLDLNDVTPTFTHATYRPFISEAARVGHLLTTVLAADADSAPNGTVTYSISPPAPSVPFRIDATTGQLRLTAALDRERVAAYNFTVLARDGGTPPLSSSARVLVTVLDVNDHAPNFTLASYERDVPENAEVGIPLLTFLATDPDAGNEGTVNYSIVAGNAEALFRLETRLGSGTLSLARSLSGRRGRSYTLLVRASDLAVPPKWTQTNAVLRVTAANLHAPEFRNLPPSVLVREDQPVDAAFLTIRAVDADGPSNGAIGRVRLSLDRLSEAQFRLNATTGVLRLRKPLDHERTTRFQLLVTAKDGAEPARSATAKLLVQVMDVNDNPPIFSPKEAFANISEGAAVNDLVAHLTATDADVISNISYHLRDAMAGGTGARDFKIGPTGKVRVARKLDREVRSFYRLVVTAVDATATGTLTGSANLSITVLDINDQRPRWPAPTLRLSVPENSAAGTVVGRLKATDDDIQENAHVVYTLKTLDDKDSSLFHLRIAPNNSVDVLVSASNSLDYEWGPKVHIFTVTAFSQTLFSKARLEIQVTDMNDNVPLFDDFVLQLDNYEGQFPVGPVVRVPASDPDVTSRLRYRLIGGAGSQLMAVDADSGLMSLDSRLNSDVDIEAQLRIEVTDGIFTKAAYCSLRTRFVSPTAVRSSVSLHLLAAPAGVVSLLPAFGAAIAALFGQPVRSFLLLDLASLRSAPDGAKSRLTFAVKEWPPGQAHRDAFVRPGVIKERVFLRTEELFRNSSVRIIPHDDSELCLVEPCPNFQRCSERNSYLKVGAFATLSPRFLLRPVVASPTASCECPAGFANLKPGAPCDAEVNMCFSRPCKNGGLCSPTEGSFHCECGPNFAGRQCEVAKSGPGPKLEPPLPAGLCRPPSRLVPLIAGGFRCDNCSSPLQGSQQQLTDLCQLRYRRFSGAAGSYLALRPLHQRSHFDLSFAFATANSSAAASSLLLFAGRYSGLRDRLTLKLMKGRLHAALSLGNASADLELQLSAGPAHCTTCRFDDGGWHTIGLSLANHTLTLSRSDDVTGKACDVGVALTLGGAGACAVSGRVALPARCASQLELCFRFLDTATPLYLGGTPAGVVAAPFEGCLGNVTVDGQLVDLRSEAVSSLGTLEGCSPKRGFCGAATCRNGGVCKEGWNRSVCHCSEAFAGRDCSVGVPAASLFSLLPNASFPSPRILLNFGASPTAFTPSRIALDFRSRATGANGTLFRQETVFSSTELVLLTTNQLLYRYNPTATPLVATCEGRLRLQDELWHRVVVSWRGLSVQLSVDDGLCSVEKSIGVSAFSAASGPIRMKVTFGAGLSGCLRRLEVAWPANVTAPLMPAPERVAGAQSGCSGALAPGDFDSCAACPKVTSAATCVSSWRANSCRCQPGFAGPSCSRICSGPGDPCRPIGATCVVDSSSSRGYRCACPLGRSGPYCSRLQMTSCAPSWWGAPLCGPCGCRTDLGQSPNCNESTGACACRSNYYRDAAATGACRPCPCYALGSSSAQCGADGACSCRFGVLGPRCDACPDLFAEVTLQGCEVQYSACPQAFGDGVLWRRTAFGQRARQTCPSGLKGYAERACSRLDGWSAPDTLNCSSKSLSGLERELLLLESGQLRPTKHLVSRFARIAATALSNRSAGLYGGDLRLGIRAMTQLAAFEAGQAGLDLTHTQDKAFLPNLLTALSALLAPSTRTRWKDVALRYPEFAPTGRKGIGSLVALLGRFAGTLAKETAVRTEIDYVMPGTALRVFSRVLPANSSSPVSLLLAASPPGPNVSVALTAPSAAAASSLTFGTLLWSNLTGLMDGADLQSWPADAPGPPEISSAVLALEVPAVAPGLTSVALQFSVTDWASRLQFRCVFWNGSGWSSEGCTTFNRSQELAGYVRCYCTHLSVFAVLSRRPALRPPRVAVSVPVGIYVLGALSLLCLLPAVVLLALILRTGYNCLSIHFHHCLSAALAILIYMAGLRAIQVQVICKLTAVFCSFFSLSSLSWLAVDSLHLYRRLTEPRNVDVGSLNFYLLLGYGAPGLAVSLSVALRAEDFGEDSALCWLQAASRTAFGLLVPAGAAVVVQLSLMLLSVIRMQRAGLFGGCCARRKPEVDGATAEAESGGRSIAARKGQVRSRPLPSSLRYNRPDLLSSISRADSRRSLSRLSVSSPSGTPSRCSALLSALSVRCERTASGRGWALFHLLALLALSPLSGLAWLSLFLGPASQPVRPSLWLAGGVSFFLSSLLASLLYSLLHARVIPALRTLRRHGGAIPKEMRASALGGAPRARIAPNPALEAEFQKLTGQPGGASTSSTTTSGGNTVVPGVYLAATSTDTSTLATGTPIGLAGFTNGVLAASQEEDESEEDEDGATMTSGDFGVDLASSHSSDDDEDGPEEEGLGPRWSLPEGAGAARRKSPSVHSSSQPTTTTDDTLYGSTARLIPGASNSRPNAIYDNPALVLSARDLASLGTGWSSASSPPPTLAQVPEDELSEADETAV